MGEVSADPTRAGVRARRETLRDDTFALRARRFETPAWLERSFVLPVQPAGDEPPAGSLAESTTPPPEPQPLRHVPAREWPEFVRPPSAEVDFATVVRRADACRLARRTALFALALTALVLGIILLTGSTTALPLMAVTVAGVLVSAVVFVVLSHAPIPHLDD